MRPGRPSSLAIAVVALFALASRPAAARAQEGDADVGADHAREGTDEHAQPAPDPEPAPDPQAAPRREPAPDPEPAPDAEPRVVGAPRPMLHLGGGAALSEPAPSPDGAPAPPIDTAPAAPPVPLLDLRWGDARDGRVERLHGWASVAFFSGRARGGDATIVAPSLGLRLALSDEIDVSGSWALAYGVASVVGEYDGGAGPEPYDTTLERVEAGNPTVLFAWSPAWGNVSLRVGVGFAIPAAALAQASSDAASAAQRAASIVVHDAMLAMHAARDPWRFLPERLSFFVPVTLAFGGDLVAGALEVAGAWTVPVLGGSGDHEAALQLAGDVAVAILPELRAGLRASIVGWGLGDGARNPRAQPAIEPWVRAVLGPGFVTLRATIDLGGDYGFGSADGGVWAIHLGGGAALERQ